jgi:hypothetical protein
MTLFDCPNSGQQTTGVNRDVPQECPECGRFVSVYSGKEQSLTGPWYAPHTYAGLDSGIRSEIFMKWVLGVLTVDGPDAMVDMP